MLGKPTYSLVEDPFLVFIVDLLIVLFFFFFLNVFAFSNVFNARLAFDSCLRTFCLKVN